MTTSRPLQVASVAVFNEDGALLFGLRSDNGKWTLPGGCLEEGEEPAAGAARELEEETGLKGVELIHLGSETVKGRNGKDVEVHAYTGSVDGAEASSENDPDDECGEWRWVDVDDGVPDEIAGNLHSPKNVTLRLLDLQDDLAKSEPLEKGLRGDWQAEGYEIRHEVDPRGGQATITAHLGGAQIGELDVGHSASVPGTLFPVNINVHKDHRRKGLATAMYQRAEQVLGAPMRRGSQSGDAKMLWSQKDRPFGKSEEPLAKMALADIPVGKGDGGGVDGRGFEFDYSHVLSPRARKEGVKLSVISDFGSAPRVGMLVRLQHPNDRMTSGTISASVDARPAGYALKVGESRLGEAHHGKGYGKAMYEALLAHAKNHVGATYIVGGTHSTLASNVHSSLARKHGLDYSAQVHEGMEDVEPGDTDDRMRPYKYALKSEVPMTKADGDDSKPPPIFHGHEPHELAKMDFTSAPPKLSKKFVFDPETQLNYTEPPEVFSNHDQADYQKTMEASFGLDKNQAHFKRLHQGLCEVVGIHPTHTGGVQAVCGSGVNVLGRDLGLYDEPVVHIRNEHVHEIMCHGSTNDYTNETGIAYETLVHELFHAASRAGHIYEAHNWAGPRPHAAMEEATTELLAQHYTNELESSHFACRRPRSSAARYKPWLVNTYDSEAHLEAPTSYATNCQQFIRLVAKAEKLHHEGPEADMPDIDGDDVHPATLLHNAVINHALLAKKSTSFVRPQHLVDRMLINHGFDLPNPTGSSMFDGFYAARNAVFDHLEATQFMEKDLSSSHLDDALAGARVAYDEYKAKKNP